jgi:hypothetical protein
MQTIGIHRRLAAPLPHRCQGAFGSQSGGSRPLQQRLARIGQALTRQIDAAFRAPLPSWRARASRTSQPNGSIPDWRTGRRTPSSALLDDEAVHVGSGDAARRGRASAPEDPSASTCPSSPSWRSRCRAPMRAGSHLPLVATVEPVTIYDLLRHTSGIVYAGLTRTEYIRMSTRKPRWDGRASRRRANRSARWCPWHVARTM